METGKEATTTVKLRERRPCISTVAIGIEQRGQITSSNEIWGMEIFAETETHYSRKNKISTVLVRAAFDKTMSKQLQS